MTTISFIVYYYTTSGYMAVQIIYVLYIWYILISVQCTCMSVQYIYFYCNKNVRDLYQ